MDAELKSALVELLTGLADDELVLGHRDSEWCGNAPILEEDIAFANLALDEIAHANLWAGLLAGLAGEDPEKYPDRLFFFRQAADYRCVQMVELPRGDWAFSMLRQYLFDAAELGRLEDLRRSAYPPLADVAAKIHTEEFYHYRHTHAWVRRLGLGTEESHRRMQVAVDQLWPYTAQLFARQPGEALLAGADYAQPAASLRPAWEARILPTLQDCHLIIPSRNGEPAALQVSATREQHTPHLKLLLAEMQSVARLDPQAVW